VSPKNSDFSKETAVSSVKAEKTLVIYIDEIEEGKRAQRGLLCLFYHKKMFFH